MVKKIFCCLKQNQVIMSGKKKTYMCISILFFLNRKKNVLIIWFSYVKKERQIKFVGFCQAFFVCLFGLVWIFIGVFCWVGLVCFFSVKTE